MQYTFGGFARTKEVEKKVVWKKLSENVERKVEMRVTAAAVINSHVWLIYEFGCGMAVDFIGKMTQEKNKNM